MSVKLAFLATLEAKEGKGGDLGAFLEAGRELAYGGRHGHLVRVPNR
jgi:hypothetical protein